MEVRKKFSFERTAFARLIFDAPETGGGRTNTTETLKEIIETDLGIFYERREMLNKNVVR
jgi:hypothetical protein